MAAPSSPAPPSAAWPSQAWLTRRTAPIWTSAMRKDAPRQGKRDDADDRCEQRQTNDRNDAKTRLEKEQPQSFRILEDAPVGRRRIAGHVDQNPGEPGKTGESRHGRGDAKEAARRHEACRRVRSDSRRRVEPEQRRAEQREDRGEMDPARDDEEFKSRQGSLNSELRGCSMEDDAPRIASIPRRPSSRRDGESVCAFGAMGVDRDHMPGHLVGPRLQRLREANVERCGV